MRRNRTRPVARGATIRGLQLTSVSEMSMGMAGEWMLRLSERRGAVFRYENTPASSSPISCNIDSVIASMTAFLLAPSTAGLCLFERRIRLEPDLLQVLQGLSCFGRRERSGQDRHDRFVGVERAVGCGNMQGRVQQQ